MSGTGAAATGAATECSGGRIDVTDEFTLFDNQWGNPDANQCVFINEDGSYGWDFDASGTSGGINYPEVYIGTRPWGSDTGVAEFPIRRRDIDEFVLDIEAEYTISNGEWDWAQEWWLMEEPPSVQTKTYQYEIMLLLDWGGGHDHGSPVYTDLWTDRYGNTIDLWALYDSGGTSATFYIFRVQGGHNGGKIDAKRISDWLTDHEGIAEDLWLSGSELGNEYWPTAVGQNTINKFALTINGSTYRSGITNSENTTSSDSTAPTAPSRLSSPDHGDSTVSLQWEGSADSGGSGLAEYVVYTDGTEAQRVDAVTTSATVSGLESERTVEFTVTAVDGAGNESAPSNVVSVTTDAGTESAGIQSGTTYRIENHNSGLVLDVQNDSKSDGGTLLQQPWTGDPTQQWVARDNGDGTYRLENTHSEKVVDVEAWSTRDGGDVHQWSWVSGANQRWTPVTNGDGTIHFENQHSGRVLDVRYGSTSPGANVQQWNWNGGDGQRWTLTPVDTDSAAPTAPSGLYSPDHGESTVALEWAGSADSGNSGLAEYVVYTDGTEAQRVDAVTPSATVSGLESGTTVDFTVTAVDGAGNESAPSNVVSVTTDSQSTGAGVRAGTTYRIENHNSGLVLDVENDSMSNGGTLLQQPWTGDPAQQWVARDNGDGTYRFENVHSGKVIDVEAWSTRDGGDVHQWSWVGGANQRWAPVTNDDGTVRFENQHSGLVLDVRYAATSPGANVQQWNWNGGDGQCWTLTPIES